MGNIIIRDKTEFQRKLAAIKKDGLSELHVVSDFDRTLTKAFIAGKKVISSYSLLRESGYLDPELLEKDQALFNKYYPMESDIFLSEEEKYQVMAEWWAKHYQLFVEYGFNKNILLKLSDDYKNILRDSTLDLFEILAKTNLPLLIFSAGMGDIIKLFLERNNLLTSNIHLISNFLKYDNSGKAIGYNSKLIHVLNKNEIEIKDKGYYKEIAGRKNVILLGDNLGDLGMTAGIKHEVVFTVGFLNEREEELLEKFKDSFDVVILGDGSMDYVNGLLKNILF